MSRAKAASSGEITAKHGRSTSFTPTRATHGQTRVCMSAAVEMNEALGKQADDSRTNCFFSTQSRLSFTAFTAPYETLSAPAVKKQLSYSFSMEATAPEKDINPVRKTSAEITHTEDMVDDAFKSETPSLTRAQIRRFTIACDVRVLPMLGVIYAVSILDRINVSLLHPHARVSADTRASRLAPRRFWACRKISTWATALVTPSSSCCSSPVTSSPTSPPTGS